MKKPLVGADATAPADKRRGALSLAALAFSGAAQAITLGDAQVRSPLGQPLEARIPVSAATGEAMRGACFSLSPQGGAGAPALTDAELALRRSAHGAYLEIRSRKPIARSDLLISVAVACPGTPRAVRDFVLLLEPPVRATPPKAAGEVALGAREGDTLQSIAGKIVPEPWARADYLRALREANPELAARGDDAPIDPRQSIALPDLRTYTRSAHRAPRTSIAAAPAPRHEARRAQPSRASEPAGTAEVPVPPSPSTAATGTPQRKPRAATRTPSTAQAAAQGQPFQLKLSAPEIDLSTSRNIGERERAQLRERLAMLDADDQVAAMLSLRHSVKQLEARVAELQLKLATMSPGLEQRSPKAPEAAPAAKPSPPAAPAPSAPSRPASAPPTTAAASATQPVSTPRSASETATASPPAQPGTQTPSAAKPASAEQTPSGDKAPSVAPPPARIDTGKLHKPHVAVATGEGSRTGFWLWLAGGAIALVLLVALLVRWRRHASAEAWLDEPESASALDDEIAPATSGERVGQAGVPRVADSDADLPTRLPTTDAEELRRRYMRERFPELATGMVSLDDAASVVKAARLLYEDGAAPRAVELLQFALETHPEELRHWLALFEIYRLERLTGEFAALAQRFHERFGDSEHWHKVRYFGREIDAGNALYQDVVDSLSTIGPRESRRLAAAASFDPLAENWLNAPMDFENEVLANELRNALMQKTSMSEQDLQPNPMPALRHVEMFTVA